MFGHLLESPSPQWDHGDSRGSSKLGACGGVSPGSAVGVGLACWQWGGTLGLHRACI